MQTVTIAKTLRALSNKPGVTPTGRAAGLERTTTKDHNMFLCVVEASPPTESENSFFFFIYDLTVPQNIRK